MKKTDVLQELLSYVKEQHYKKGDKLPSERDLSSILDISRTTLREALRRLEERGVVISKRGSGIYLNKSAEALAGETHLLPQDEESSIREQLEARFLITPTVVSCATSRATEEEIKSLQNAIVQMSRAIVTKDLHALAEAESHFYMLLALMTRNHKLVKIMEQLNSGNEIFWEYFITNDEFVNNVIFAGYVEMVNAIKRQDPYEAGELTKRNIINLCEWFAKTKDTSGLDVFGIKKTKL